ncbi:hypothetical protein N9006_00495 [bacterium]|nr:hypothetical protein [Mariniblastus sp.]MDA7870550.1 hypothetical protein [bacterium]MDA7905392.1 hypothetical protein [Mariniblastus sp.]MDA7924614.1 hypothetical protein [Mariniblastus sp.]MDA7928503.1 hypothetical protein [Mariniblastus sp.]
MHMVWGILMMAIGLLMVIWGSAKSEFVIYRILSERSKTLWGDNVHRFYQMAGIAVTLMGILVALKVIGR